MALDFRYPGHRYAGLVLQPESGRGLVILTDTGGGPDTVFPGNGGYPSAKRLTREVLGIDGRCDLRHGCSGTAKANPLSTPVMDAGPQAQARPARP